ncbi:MAG: lysophospholipid acyltransferase family protein [Candidatus Levybacteria bacterium]|nr:lysophospholipid acyltransferase family protein [Candidatus Levybacteria bacterium]
MNFRYLPPNFFQRLVWMPLRLSIILFCSLKIKGIEHIKKTQGNFIVASNHISEMDPLLLVSVLPFFYNHLPLLYVGRQKSLYTGSKWKRVLYGGIFFKIIGAYPSYKGQDNYHKALPHHLEAVSKGVNIAIFPYGGIFRDHDIRKARGGVSFLAHETNLPVIPLKIKGTENFTLKNITSGKMKISFIFGKPLYAKDIFKNPNKVIVNSKRNDYFDAARLVMDSVENLN